MRIEKMAYEVKQNLVPSPYATALFPEAPPR